MQSRGVKLSVISAKLLMLREAKRSSGYYFFGNTNELEVKFNRPTYNQDAGGGSMEWITDVAHALSLAAQSKKPILIDFFAEG